MSSEIVFSDVFGPGDGVSNGFSDIFGVGVDNESSNTTSGSEGVVGSIMVWVVDGIKNPCQPLGSVVEGRLEFSIFVKKTPRGTGI